LNLAQLCEAYVAAGLPPERFWDITPRMYVTELNGAIMRIKRERTLVWSGAMLVRMDKPPTLAQFIDEKTQADPPEFLEMRLRSAEKGLRSVPMSEVRAMMRRQ